MLSTLTLLSTNSLGEVRVAMNSALTRREEDFHQQTIATQYQLLDFKFLLTSLHLIARTLELMPTQAPGLLRIF